MYKSFTAILFLLLIIESSAQSNFRYETGISFGYDVLQPRSYENELAYFHSSYNSGIALTLGVSNKLNYKKLFLRFQASYGLAFQSQDFVFSNEIDFVIDHTVQHQLPHWTLDFSFGRDFDINELNQLQLEIGFSTINKFRLVNLEKNQMSGSFTSTYIAPEDHYDGLSVAEYDYTIDYKWSTSLSPFIKCGLSVPLAKNRLVFGIAARWNRLDYQNFIILSSDNYNAVARSRTQSSALGFFLNYEFSK
jgi:hypothetical protein